jgi:hypothetical protein
VRVSGTRVGMEIINQLAAPLATSAAVARQQTSEKTQQISRAQTARKNVAAQADTFEHQVESCEELSPIHDEAKDAKKRQQPDEGKKRRKPAANDADAPPALDIKA